MIIIQRSIFITPEIDYVNKDGVRLSRLQKEILIRFSHSSDLFQENVRIGKELNVSELLVAESARFILPYLNVKTRWEAIEVACDRSIISRLNATEQKVLVRLTIPNKEIAKEIDRSLRTVEKSIEDINKKVKAKNRIDALLRSLKLGIITLAPFAGERPTFKFKEAHLDVLACLYMNNHDIVEMLDHKVKKRTIDHRIDTLREKLVADTRAEAFIKGIQLGLIDIPMPPGMHTMEEQTTVSP